MKLIKVLSVLVVCFVVLSNSLIIGYASDDFEPVYPLPEDLIDMGFVLDENGDFVYTGNDDPFDFGFSTFISSQKNWPDFDPITDIPWSKFPQYIKDIIYMDLDDLSASEGEPFQVPFVLIEVTDAKYATLWVGINCGLGQINNSSLYSRIFSVVNSTTQNTIAPYSVLYRFVWIYSENRLSRDWEKQVPTDYGNKGNLIALSPWAIGNDAAVEDYYVYGANGIIYPSKATSISVPYDSSDTNKSVGFYTAKSGFQSGRYLYGQDIAYPYTYFQYFVPPSEISLNNQLQQEQNSLIDEGNKLQQEQNDKLDDMMGATGVPDSIVDDYNNAESDLVDDYNPDNIENDLDIELDSSALAFIWDLFDSFVTTDNAVFTLFISIMSIGILALILGR